VHGPVVAGAGTNEEGARRPPASSSSHESDAPALRRRATPQRLAFGLSAIALVVLAVAAYLSPWLRSSEPTLLRAVPSQLTTAPGLQAEPAVSPDGSLVAFVSDEGGTPRRVTNGAGAYRVRWSRPERMLVSGSWGGATVSVRIVNPVSGTVTTPNPPVVFGDDENMCDFDVSPDDRMLAFGRTTRMGNIWKLYGRF